MLPSLEEFQLGRRERMIAENKEYHHDQTGWMSLLFYDIENHLRQGLDKFDTGYRLSDEYVARLRIKCREQGWLLDYQPYRYSRKDIELRHISTLNWLERRFI